MVSELKLRQYAKEYLLAKEVYERAVRITLLGTEPLQDKEIFWKMISDLQELVRDGVQNRWWTLSKSVEVFARSVHVSGGDGYEASDFPAFIRTYARLKERLAKQLIEPLHDWGEKGFCYLIDNLPLLGKEACLQILAGEITDSDKMTELVSKRDERYFCDFVLHGENHVEQNLEDAYVNSLSGYLIENDEAFLLELENADPEA
jgi:hypothetical protein